MAGTVVILFTDIVGSTDLQSRLLGDDAFDVFRRAHFEILEREVAENGGEAVKRLGDGVMATFGGASDVVSAAVAMQRAVHAVVQGRDGALVSIRVGVSAGDASKEDDDWYGAPVVESAWLCAAAASGQVLVSEVVRLLVGSRGGHEFVAVGAAGPQGAPGPGRRHRRWCGRRRRRWRARRCPRRSWCRRASCRSRAGPTCSTTCTTRGSKHDPAGSGRC